MKRGIDLIAEERQRQIAEEGWTAEHDASHTQGQLAYAAIAYALPPDEIEVDLDQTNGQIRGWVRFLRSKFFPWEIKMWKPTPYDRIRELAKAGALIAAGLDRLQREKHISK